MQTFSTVEEYIEAIAGYIDLTTGKRTSNWFLSADPIISLARYDVSVIESMSQSAINGHAFTERQGDLACKIILKYQRQLANKGIDVSPVENPTWRTPLRKMDYSKRAYIDNDVIQLRFPYDNRLIESIRQFKSSSQGRCEFNYDKKIWEIALTEYNLNWVVAWASGNEIEINEDIKFLFNKMMEVEKEPYAIELVYSQDGLDITNCPNSLREYIIEHCGGFGADNLLRLVDASAELGYTINSDLAEALIVEYGPRFIRLASNVELKINPESRTADDDFGSVLDYADQVGRWPVVIYEPDLTGKLLNRLTSSRPANQIYSVKNSLPTEFPADIKYIHIIKPVRHMRIPLLVSTAGMIFGADKQTMMQNVGKVVYVAAEVYNTGNKTKKVPKIAG